MKISQMCFFQADLLSEILFQLNGIQIIAPESDVDVDPIELQPEQQQLTQILLTLRLLGKFLGFVTFLPYQSPEKLPDSMQATCIAMREKVRTTIRIFFDVICSCPLSFCNDTSVCSCCS